MTAQDMERPYTHAIISPEAATRLCNAALRLGGDRSTMFAYDIQVEPETGKTTPTHVRVRELTDRAALLVYIHDPHGKESVLLEGVNPNADDPLAKVFRAGQEI